MALRRRFLEPDAELAVPFLVGRGGSEVESFSFFAVGADALSGWDPLNMSMRVRCLLVLTVVVEVLVAVCDMAELVLPAGPSPCDWVDFVVICVSMSSRYTTYSP